VWSLFLATELPDPPDRTSPLYDVSADGQRFAVFTGDRATTTTITSLANQPAELKKWTHRRPFPLGTKHSQLSDAEQNR
jgi:hypothetical protein